MPGCCCSTIRLCIKWQIGFAFSFRLSFFFGGDPSSLLPALECVPHADTRKCFPCECLSLPGACKQIQFLLTTAMSTEMLKGAGRVRSMQWWWWVRARCIRWSGLLNWYWYSLIDWLHLGVCWESGCLSPQDWSKLEYLEGDFFSAWL